MARANAVVHLAVATSFIALSTIAIIIGYTYNVYIAEPSPPPHVGRQQCVWRKPKTRKWRKTKTPPWLSLLADYQATVSSGRNLYVWPASASTYRLGNKLFNYAATFGIAWRNHRIPLWPENRASREYDITQFFNLRIPADEKNTIMQSPATRTLPMHALGSGIYDRKFERISARNVSIDSIFASYKYFQHVEEELRQDLTFKPSIVDTARRWLEQRTPDKWKDKTFVRVLIHVRRTDYTDARHEQDGWPSPTDDYFQRATSFFTDCLRRVLFVVLSDDPVWCRKHIHATDIVYSSGHSPIVDMAIASLCDHAILTVGTYGWWAAWFANGLTVTQRNLPRNGSQLSRRLYRADHYKPEYIAL